MVNILQVICTPCGYAHVVCIFLKPRKTSVLFPHCIAECFESPCLPVFQGYEPDNEARTYEELVQDFLKSMR